MSIFRQKALKRLSSPENLDEALVAASPMHWIAYLTAATLVGLALAWAIFGSVPTRVQADGIILHRGSEIFSAAAEGSGELVSIDVKLGDRVTAGQDVATLDQNLDVTRLTLAEARLESAIERQQSEAAAQAEDTVLRRALMEKERRSLQEKIGNARSRLVNLQELVADMKRLLDQGFVERSRLLARQNELIQVRETIADLDNALVKLEVQDRERAEYWKDKRSASSKEVEAVRDEIESMREQLRRVRTVDAPISGVVTEISASLGDVVAPGTPIIRVVSDAAEMDALLFVPPADGKLIKRGLSANVEPSVAKKEEYGTILAQVQSVSELPLSTSAIQAMLHNEKLVQRFSAKGSPVAVRADLLELEGLHAPGAASEHDNNQVERFRWTGGKGPAFSIEQGTLVSATITVRQQRPITLVLPFLKSVIGL